VLRATILYLGGLILGVANTVRHRVRGYRTPRRFGSTDWAQAEPYDRRIVERWRERYPAVEFSDRRILEIGPGPDLGTGALMLSEGATSYLAVDRFPLAQAVPDEFYRRFGLDDATRLSYVQQVFPELPDLEGPFDLVVSNAALEHVDDVAGLFRRLAELVPPGGVMLHNVDGKAHMRPFDRIDPLNLHRYSERVYRRLLYFPGAPNRLLSNDYARFADAAGFDVEVVSGSVLGDVRFARDRRYLHRSYRDRADARMPTFSLVAIRR
jgi:SAM-dependent methyltransferase